MMRAKAMALAAALALATVGAAAGPATAADDDKRGGTDQSPEDLAIEGMDKIIAALELMLRTIPTYEMPEILPNGDIIIRRAEPDDEEDAPAPPDSPPDADDGTPNPI